MDEFDYFLLGMLLMLILVVTAFTYPATLKTRVVVLSVYALVCLFALLVSLVRVGML